MIRLLALLMQLFLLSGCLGAIQETDAMKLQVSALVNQTVGSQDRQETAFQELESLGEAAVPYLIGHLNDTRQLKNPHISLNNKSPDAFEAFRHYGPETVHDALTAILNQITGQSFEWVYNGATLAQRQLNQTKWVAWCLDTFPTKTAACHGI